MSMTYSQACIDLTKSSEGRENNAYWDADGKVWTIGYGHTGLEVVEGLHWTDEQCDAQLAADLQLHAESVEQSFPNRTFTQGQFDCLTDLFFNVGATKLRNIAPLFWKAVTTGDDASVPFNLYHTDAEGSPHGLIFAGGKILPGLITRRQKEIALWNS